MSIARQAKAPRSRSIFRAPMPTISYPRLKLKPSCRLIVRVYACCSLKITTRLAFATQALKELGFDSVHAMNAEHALNELSKDCGRFHIVFSDVVMPGMSGFELGQEIRRLYPDVPVVLTSGYSHVLAQNGKHGFELLHKPYSVEQLSRVLHKAIKWAASRQLR